MLSNPKHIELKLPRGIMFEGDDDHDSTEEDESDDQGWDFSKRIRDSRIQGEKEREKQRFEVKNQIKQLQNEKLESLKTKLGREITSASYDGEKSLVYSVSETEASSWCFEARSGKESLKTSIFEFVKLIEEQLERYNFEPVLIKNGFYDKRKNKWCNGFQRRADGVCANCGFTETVHELNTIKSFTISWKD